MARKEAKNGRRFSWKFTLILNQNWQFLFNIEKEREEGGDPKWVNISFWKVERKRIIGLWLGELVSPWKITKASDCRCHFWRVTPFLGPFLALLVHLKSILKHFRSTTGVFLSSFGLSPDSCRFWERFCDYFPSFSQSLLTFNCNFRSFLIVYFVTFQSPLCIMLCSFF